MAARRYAALVAQGHGVDLWTEGVNRQIYLGDDEFVTQMQDQADALAKRNRSLPKAQRAAPKTLAHWLPASGSR